MIFIHMHGLTQYVVTKLKIPIKSIIFLSVTLFTKLLSIYSYNLLNKEVKFC